MTASEEAGFQNPDIRRHMYERWTLVVAIFRKFYSVSNSIYGNYTAILKSKRLHSFALKPYFLFTWVK